MRGFFFKYQYIILLLFMFCFYSNASFAQDKCTVRGYVTIDGGDLDNVLITLFKDSQQKSVRNVPKNGKFSYTLDFGYDYIFEFSKKDFVTKKISVSTYVPQDVLERDSRFPPCKFSIKLFRFFPDIDLSVFDSPIGMIMYNNETDLIETDLSYLTEIEAELKRIERETKLREKAFLAERARINTAYNLAIKKADAEFHKKAFVLSKTYYTQALVLKSAETYPKEQIGKIDLLLVGQKEQLETQRILDEKYIGLIEIADKQFTETNFDQAKISYSLALDLKPKEEYPKSQILKIQNIELDIQRRADKEAQRLKEEKALNEKYVTFISTADKAFASKQYADAKLQYGFALKLKPSELHPQSQIQTIDERLAEEKRLAEENAKIKAEQKALDLKFNEFIKDGDNLLKRKKYLAAKTAYQSASDLKPEEVYPQSQIQEIDRILMNQKEIAEDKAQKEAEKKLLDEKYTALLSSADQFLLEETYEKAKQIYTEASVLKPEETYPKDQMVKIDRIVKDKRLAAGELAKQKDLNDQYKSFVSQADAQMETKDFDNALTNYQLGLELKPKEAYPKQQLKKIKLAIAEKAKQVLALKSLNAKYERFILMADEMFSKKTLDDARLNYNKALELKPNADYPRSQLSKIDDLIAEKVRLNSEKVAFEEKYNQYISTANSELKAGVYTLAKQNYIEALAMKPNEIYPKSQLQKLVGLMEKRARIRADKKLLEGNYSNLINQADTEFKSEDYANAVSSYQQASSLKPKEVYPKVQLRKAKLALSEQNRLADEKAKQEQAMQLLDEKYTQVISLADAGFSSANYKKAVLNYNKALSFKSGDSYATSQLQKIKDLIAAKESEANELALLTKEKEESDKRFRSFIKKGDRLFAEKSFESSLISYEQALEIKVNDKYAQAQVDRIKEFIQLRESEKEKLLTVSEDYKKYIEKADELYSEDALKLAKEQYLLALDIKQKEVYPKTQIARIDVDLEKQARLEKRNKKAEQEFENAIKTADSHFKKESYSLAKHHYKLALKIKPDDAYSQSQLREITMILNAKAKAIEDDLLTQNQNSFDDNLLIKKENDYEEFVAKADKAFRNKYLGMAKVYYSKALKLFERDYPQDKLIEIEKMKMTFKSEEVREEYERLMSSGDDQLGKNNYSVARHYYNKAMPLASDKNQVLDKLELIKKGVAAGKQKVLDAEFNTLFKKGDKAYNTGNLSVAKFYYLKALKIKPEDAQVKKSLEIITKTLK